MAALLSPQRTQRAQRVFYKGRFSVFSVSSVVQIKCIKIINRRESTLLTLFNSRGFTLIEIIVAIIISAVLATILAQVVSNSNARSYAPLQTVNENLALRAVMENITADHRFLTKNYPDPLTTLSSKIASGAYWNVATVTNGIRITAIDNGCITLDTTNGEASVTCSTAGAMLKVTIAVQNNSGHRLTALFTR